MSEQEKRLAELQNLAENYLKVKPELDVLDKKCKSLNTSIKALMETLNFDAFAVGDKEIVYSVQKRESLDEEKLIKQLKHFAPFTKCIKTKEYIDMDILEGEIYHGELSDDALCAMDSCRNVKEIPMLKIVKGKKK